MAFRGEFARTVAASLPVQARSLLVRDERSAAVQMLAPDRTTLFVAASLPETTLSAIPGRRLTKVVTLPWLREVARPAVLVESASGWRDWTRLRLSEPLLRSGSNPASVDAVVGGPAFRPVPVADLHPPATSPLSTTAANGEHALALQEGWHALWLGMVARLAFLDPEPVVASAWPKFDELRVGWSGQVCDAAIRVADETSRLSIRTCSLCGSPGERRTWSDGVVATRCKRHPWSSKVASL